MNLTSHTHIWQTSAAWDPAELSEDGEADQELPWSPWALGASGLLSHSSGECWSCSEHWGWHRPVVGIPRAKGISCRLDPACVYPTVLWNTHSCLVPRASHQKWRIYGLICFEERLWVQQFLWNSKGVQCPTTGETKPSFIKFSFAKKWSILLDFNFP